MKIIVRFVVIFISTTTSYLSQDLKLGLPVGHTESINSVMFSNNGKIALTASWDKTARIWDVITGKQIMSIKEQSKEIQLALFSPDGKTLVTTTGEKIVRIWDVNNGKLIHTLEGHVGEVSFAHYSTDSKKIITVSKNIVYVWDVESGNQIKLLQGHSNDVNYAQFSSDGKMVATVSNDYYTRIWDANTGNLIKLLKGHFFYVNTVKFSPDSKSIVTGSSDDTALIWDIQTGSSIPLIKGHSDDINYAEFSPDGNIVVTVSDDKTARLWDANSGKQIHILKGHKEDVQYAQFSPDGKKVATVSNECNVRLWDVNSGNLIHSFQGFVAPDWYLPNVVLFKMYSPAQFSPDGKSILTSSQDNKARQYEVESGKELKAFCGHTSETSAVHCLDGKLALTPSSDGTVPIYELGSGKEIQILSGHTEMVESAFFSPDGKLALTVSKDNTTRIYEVSSGKELQVLSGYRKHMRYAVFSPDGKLALKTSNHNIARIYEVSTGKILRILRGYRKSFNSPVFSPNGKYVLNHSRNIACIYDVSNGKSRQIQRNSKYCMIYSSVFSPDGKLVLTASSDKTARIYEVSSGKELQLLRGHTDNVKSAVFSPDGKLALTASWDKTARIYEVSSGIELQVLSGHSSWVSSAVFSPDGKLALTASWDNSARIYEVSTGKELQVLSGHSDGFHLAQFVSDGKKIVVTSKDGSITYWDALSGNQLIKLYVFDENPKKWVHIHPSGLFDASPEAMEMMYWTKGIEVIEFSQLKDRYWLPGLWAKVMSGQELPKVSDMQELKLYPEVEIKSIDQELVNINLTKREGGYGAVKILLNGKEISQDARGKEFNPDKDYQSLKIDVKNHPFLKDGENIVSVIASSENGINSRGVQGTIIRSGNKTKEPHFFAVIVGIGNYANEQINLKYPVADANAISKAISLGANNLFKDRSHIYNLTSESYKKPTKENIKAVFEEIAKIASSDDIIFLYLAGHGVSTSGENGDFYYLTADATSANQEAYRDEQIRKLTAISTNEWVDWLKQIPALKQVMILDACGSGKVVDKLISMREIEPSQIKAIDRMKDRTGMYIISGCAADAVSYEASQYGQGLLTYALLQGIKGAALKENKYIDVSTILNHARESVPNLAAGIGGIQTPQLLQPKGGSFDIGILNDEDKKNIILSEPKQVFIRSILVDKKKYRDILEISKRLNDELNSLSSRGDKTEIVFFDSEDYSNSCQVTGGYSQTDNEITLEMTVICKSIETQFVLNAKNVDELINKIVEKLGVK